MKLAELTWPDVEKYIATKKQIIVPVGSTEQHGPTGIIGIDYLSAQFLAEEAGKRTSTLVAPPLPYGMALHHMAFPGTIALTPSTYIQVIVELIQSLRTHGFDNLIFINGHGGNIAPLTSAFSEAKKNNDAFKVKLINWWHLPEVQAYEKEVFKDENGFHATCGEISVTMKTHPEAYAKIQKHQSFPPSPKKYHWPMGAKEFRQYFVDGRMGSNPALASKEHGEKLFEIAVGSITNILSEV